MSKTQLKPILNTSLPPQFRRIRIELAREPDHPEGERSVAYVIVAPLAHDGLIDAKLWKQHREACRVVRCRPGEPDQLGHLIQHSGSVWAFHYNDGSNIPDEAGYHFANEHFVAGEYVSINERGKMHTYRVTAVSHL